MNKGDFVGGLQVEPILGAHQVMTLGGSKDDWICTWVEDGKTMTQHFQPDQLQIVSASRSPK
jgi:hypothetical protein